jgi:hypothetical protein
MAISSARRLGARDPDMARSTEQRKRLARVATDPAAA